MDHAGLAFGQVDWAQAFDRRRLGAEEADVAQVVDTGHGVVGCGWVVEGGGDFFVAAVSDAFGEGGVDLLRGGDQAFRGGCEGFDPTGCGGVVLGVADDQRGLVEAWVVRGYGGG